MSKPSRPPVVVAVAAEQPSTLRYAIDEAHRLSRDLDVVHCAGYGASATRVLDRIYFENWIEAADHVLDEVRRSVAREFDPPTVRYRLSDHHPVDELLHLSTKAAALIVGSDNPYWFGRMLGPGVSQVVARAAVCPVVVVPEDQPEVVRAQGVVVGIEGDHPEEHLLRYAFDQADRRACALRVLHALPPGAATDDSEIHQMDVSLALAGWSEKYPGVNVERQFIEGTPTRILARATLNAELVVVGQPHPGLLPYAVDRPVSHGLLKHAHRPVAVVPESFS